MIKTIDFKKAKCIVEYGPGTGVFTEKILARAQDNTIILLIEINKEFYNILNDLYSHKRNVIVLNESAENIDKILEKYSIDYVDYVISGLPFASLPEAVSNAILTKTSAVIKAKGEVIIFQYTLMRAKYIRRFFNKINHRRVMRNIPPAYVLNCKIEENSF